MQMEALASALGRAESNFAMTSAVQQQPAAAAAGASWAGPAMRHSGAGGVVAETLRKLIENDYARQWVQVERGPAARALMSGLARLLTHPSGSSDALVRTSSRAYRQVQRWTDRHASVHTRCRASVLLCLTSLIHKVPGSPLGCPNTQGILSWGIVVGRSARVRGPWFAHALHGLIDRH